MKEKFQMLHKATFVLLGVTFVSGVLLVLYEIVTRNMQVNFIANLILAIFLLIAYILVLSLAMRFYDRKGEKAIVILSILFLLFNGYQFLTISNILVLPSNAVVENFYGKDITEVIKWAEENGVTIEQVYEHSDTVEKYKIISQDVESGTLLKDVKKIVVVISDGVDEEKTTSIPNMVGWSLDEALEFIDANHLTNVTIDFQFSDRARDVIIKQSIVSNDVKRNEAFTLCSSLGDKEDEVEARMENLVGKSLWDAEIFFKRNRIPYEIVYSYSDEKKDGTVLEQSIRKGFLVRSSDTEKVVIMVSKKDAISVPDLKKLSASQITAWATENHLKVYFKEEFDDTIPKGKVISASIVKGEIVKPDDEFTVTLSKGSIRMIEFTDIDAFRKWAKENDVCYRVDYEFSDSVAAGKLISTSHKKGDIIKNTDTVNIVISQGGKTLVPNFVGKSKGDALKMCIDSHLKCSFTSSSSSKEKDTVIKQSMRSGSNVPMDTSITLTISSGE